MQLLLDNMKAQKASIFVASIGHIGSVFPRYVVRQATKEKIRKWNYITLKSFCTANKMANKMKGK